MNEPRSFPWTFDQYQRYAVLKAVLEVFFKEKSPVVLDAGGISPGRPGEAPWLPVGEISPGKSYVLDREYVREDGFIQGDAAALPFQDNRLDVVSALDVIEHIPPEKREAVLEELGRVSRDLVVVSAPIAGKEVEEAEAMLYDQVLRLHRTGHAQLEEHRRFGLPKIEKISGIFESSGLTVAGFSYGCLAAWMFFQSLKHAFLFRPESKSILECVDWFAAGYLNETEFRPPYIRHFWLVSGKRDKRELEAGVQRIQSTLKEKGGAREREGRGELEKLAVFNRELIRFFYPDKVTAVILAESGGQKLRESLQHVLSQKVFFDFEVSVWNTSGDPDIKYMVEVFYPAVTYLSWKKSHSGTFRERMLELFCRLKGDHILLLDEAVLLPQDAAARFLKELRDSRRSLTGGAHWLFMRRTVFSDLDWDEKLMRKKVEKMTKKEIFTVLCEGLKR